MNVIVSIVLNLLNSNLVQRMSGILALPNTLPSKLLQQQQPATTNQFRLMELRLWLASNTLCGFKVALSLVPGFGMLDPCSGTNACTGSIVLFDDRLFAEDITTS
eukprot:Blabericola_migrator_1__1367@NODE_1355_length_4733_cov_207_171239_g910_i0_p4_GENE_NODE_1355_length_4733_cov_207_171239_g910_i0NODE_1355_length_4733_cov_207_171239_g910_i0_p4_ORF_typecomplete_len105_score12_04_NODE_1355_length_4733_cov_207_171239_g910_i014461760